MKLKVKVKSGQLPDLNVILTNAWHRSVDIIDYAEFYNLQSVLKMVADTIYKNNLMHKKERQLVFDLNQYKTLRKVIEYCQASVLPSVYEFVLINEIFAECDRQLGIIRTKQEQFYNSFNSLMIGGPDA